jgi:hypothetical protein
MKTVASNGGLEHGCKCLSNIKETLTKHHGDNSDVCLDLKQTINIETLDLGKSLPPLHYSYLDGKKRKKSYVTFNFCPFCGKKS